MLFLLYLVNLLCYIDILWIPQQERCLCKGEYIDSDANATQLSYN